MALNIIRVTFCDHGIFATACDAFYPARPTALLAVNKAIVETQAEGFASAVKRWRPANDHSIIIVDSGPCAWPAYQESDDGCLSHHL